MDNDEQRDSAEEKYNREFCIPCGTSPCQWDGKPDGFHTDENPDGTYTEAGQGNSHPVPGVSVETVAAIAESEQVMAAGTPLVTLDSALTEARELDDWSPADLLALVHTAGELWLSTDRADPDDVLNEYQRSLLERAAASHLAETDGLGDFLVQVPEHHNDLGDWCPRSGEYSADGACPLYCRHADDIMGIDASRDEEDEEDDRSGTEFGDWLDERPLDEPDTLREMRGQS